MFSLNLSASFLDRPCEYFTDNNENSNEPIAHFISCHSGTEILTSFVAPRTTVSFLASYIVDTKELNISLYYVPKTIFESKNNFDVNFIIEEEDLFLRMYKDKNEDNDDGALLISYDNEDVSQIIHTIIENRMFVVKLMDLGHDFKVYSGFPGNKNRQLRELKKFLLAYNENK